MIEACGPPKTSMGRLRHFRKGWPVEVAAHTRPLPQPSKRFTAIRWCRSPGTSSHDHRRSQLVSSEY